MSEKELEQLKIKVIPILKKYGVIRAGVFGSFARGEATKNSDIDFLIRFIPGKSLFDLVGVKLDIEDKLGKKIDVITYNSIHPLLKNQILGEEKVLYEKRS